MHSETLSRTGARSVGKSIAADGEMMVTPMMIEQIAAHARTAENKPEMREIPGFVRESTKN